MSSSNVFPLRNTKPPPYLLFGGLIKRKHVQITMIDCEKFVLISVDLTAWLLLLCNDVEKNPGPKSRRSESQPAKPSKQEAAESRQTNRKFDMLEKHLTKLEKELLATRRMGKTNLFCFLQKCPLIQHHQVLIFQLRNRQHRSKTLSTTHGAKTGSRRK